MATPKRPNRVWHQHPITVAAKYITQQGGTLMLLSNLGTFCTFIYPLPYFHLYLYIIVSRELQICRHCIVWSVSQSIRQAVSWSQCSMTNVWTVHSLQARWMKQHMRWWRSLVVDWKTDMTLKVCTAGAIGLQNWVSYTGFLLLQ